MYGVHCIICWVQNLQLCTSLQEDGVNEDLENKAEMLGFALDACKKAAEITYARRSKSCIWAELSVCKTSLYRPDQFQKKPIHCTKQTQCTSILRYVTSNINEVQDN